MTTPVQDHQDAVRRVEAALYQEPFLSRGEARTTSLEKRMAILSVPGASIAVVDEGRLAWARGYGVRENGRRDPVTPETMFQAASISKPVTAVATFRLVERDVLDLDEDVNRYLVSWKVPAVWLVAATGHYSPDFEPYSRPDSPWLSRLQSRTAGAGVAPGAERYRSCEHIASAGECAAGYSVPLCWWRHQRPPAVISRRVGEVLPRVDA